MTLRSDRRRRCQYDTARVAVAAAVQTERTTRYWEGALDRSLELYFVRAALTADSTESDREIGRAYCALQHLVPLACDLEDETLVCELLASAYSSEAAAWTVVARVRELTELRLVTVSAGPADGVEPEVVLTGSGAGPGATAGLCA